MNFFNFAKMFSNFLVNCGLTLKERNKEGNQIVKIDVLLSESFIEA